MGRKTASGTNKNKEKRQGRKEEQRKIADATAIVTAANSSTADLISSYFAELRLFENNDLNVELKCFHANNFDRSTFQWAIDLTERNMRTLYENCAWGWDARKKLEELTDDVAWYLVATNVADGKPVGFSHFRFDVDFGEPVLYCYELQLEAGGRRRGLGARMLAALEATGRGTRATRVRLTALRHNAPAAAFFHACGYTLDKTSPDREDAVHYEILSKQL